MSGDQYLISSEAALAERMRLARLMTDVAVALTRNDSLPKILASCARSLVEHLDAAFARIWTLNDEENILELQASEGMYTHLDGAHSRVPVGKLKIGVIAKERKPHLTNAVLGDPRIGDQEWARRENIVSFAGYPLIIGNHLVGVIAMFARVPLSRPTLEAMEIIAHGIALGIERKQSEDAARASTEQVARIVESITDGFATVDRDLRYAFVNGEGARIIGRTIEELLGKPIYEAFPDIKGTPFDRAMRRAIQDQKPQEIEEYFPPMNKWFSLRLFPTPDGLSLYYRDVTERKISEQRLLLQYAVSRVLNAGNDVETTGNELLSAIGLSLSWRVGLMWTPDRDGKYLRCSHAYRAPNVFESEFVDVSCRTKLAQGEGLPGLVWEIASPYWAVDFASDRRFPRAAIAAAEGLHAAFAFPILARGEFVGVIEFLNPGIRRPDANLLQTVTDIGRQIGQYFERHWAAESLKVSELRKSAILETALDAIITVDQDSRIIEFNTAAEAIFGHKREDVTGKSMPELIIPERFRDRHYRGLEQYLQTGEGPVLGQRIELSALRADGSEFPVELAINRVPVENAILFTAYLRDITERKYHEREREDLLARAEAAQRYYRVLTEAMPQQVWTASADGALDYVNKGACDYFGVNQASVIGAGWQGFVHPEDLEACGRRWSASLTSGEPYEVEFRLKRADGEYRWHLGRALPVRNSAGAVTKWLGTNTDVHDRLIAQQELRSAKESAEAASQAKSDFLASMSHELRTPLNAIIGYSEMLEEEALDLGVEPFASDLPKIHGAGKHLLSLINDVLDLSKIEAGKMELFIETFDVRSMINAVVDTIHPLAGKKGNQLLVECGPNLGSMTADLTKVRQSLFNLLSNSSKFTENGRIRLLASRFQSGGTDWCEFRVTDTGIGIPEEKQLSVFEPFSQVDEGRSRKFGGTGLGLAITKRFCEMMGGQITLTSEPGKGSEFCIRLPATTACNAERETAPAPAQAHQNTVLIVDDDPAAQELLRRFMEREGYHPVSASSGSHALQIVKEVHPVAITLDVMMPGMDGWAVLSSLKNDPETADIPVIIVSIVDDKNLGYALGAAEYLTKPIDRERFSKVLDRYRCTAGNCPVLLVEDDPAVRQTLRSVLERHGWRVSEAGNGAIALEIMANEAPELILLDLIMPEMDGFEFAEHMRKNEQWRSIPVIIITSKDLTADEISRLNGNVERILRKESYAYSDLLGEIHRIAANSGRLLRKKT